MLDKNKKTRLCSRCFLGNVSICSLKQEAETTMYRHALKKIQSIINVFLNLIFDSLSSDSITGGRDFL